MNEKFIWNICRIFVHGLIRHVDKVLCLPVPRTMLLTAIEKLDPRFKNLFNRSVNSAWYCTYFHA